jgi:hypothetical protein
MTISPAVRDFHAEPDGLAQKARLLAETGLRHAA